MSESKIKIKIGDHEFEAEGPADLVREQFAVFKDLIAAVPATKASPKNEEGGGGADPTVNPANSSNAVALERITRNEGRIVSLTVHNDDIAEAALVILLGQRQFRSNDQVTGSEIMDGLRESGLVVTRVDYTLDKLAESGHVIRIGVGRSRRYRLTNTGLNKAQEIARTMISILP